MISQAMKCLCDHLNESLGAHDPTGRPCVRLGRLKDTTGDRDAMLTLSLVNLAVDPQAAATLPGLRLTVLLAAAPGLDYTDSLNLLSAAVRSFHAVPELNTASHPMLMRDFESVRVTPLSLDLDGLRGVWSLQGTPYRPSIAYEVHARPLSRQPAPGMTKSTVRNRWTI